MSKTYINILAIIGVIGIIIIATMIHLNKPVNLVNTKWKEISDTPNDERIYSFYDGYFTITHNGEVTADFNPLDKCGLMYYVDPENHDMIRADNTCINFERTYMNYLWLAEFLDQDTMLLHFHAGDTTFKRIK